MQIISANSLPQSGIRGLLWGQVTKTERGH